MNKALLISVIIYDIIFIVSLNLVLRAIYFTSKHIDPLESLKIIKINQFKRRKKQNEIQAKINELG